MKKTVDQRFDEKWVIDPVDLWVDGWDDTAPVDVEIAGADIPRGITFRGVVLMADRPVHYKLEIDGIAVWVPKFDVVSMTMGCGELGDVVLTEEASIRLGLV